MDNLLNLKNGERCKIIKINIENIALKAQLKNLMIEEGEVVTVKGFNYGKRSIMIEVSKTNFAVDSSVAKQIEVEVLKSE